MSENCVWNKGTTAHSPCDVKSKWEVSMKDKRYRVCGKHLDPTCSWLMLALDRDAITVQPIFMNWDLTP